MRILTPPGAFPNLILYEIKGEINGGKHVFWKKKDRGCKYPPGRQEGWGFSMLGTGTEG
jgi:hypothetical protein